MPKAGGTVFLCLLLILGCRRYPQGEAANSSLPGAGGDSAGSTAGLPNIVFAVYDNTRFDRYSINGNTRKTSPFFDRLASEGVYLAGAVAPATWTFPSHASMFTGFRNHQLKVDMEGDNNLVLDPGVRTIAQLLARRGYFTVTFPDHPYFGPVNASLSRGFRFFDIMFNPLQTPSLSFSNVPDGVLRDRRVTVPKPTLEENLRVKAQFRRRLGRGDVPYQKPPPESEVFPSLETYVDKYVKRRYRYLMDVLARRGDRPFFLFLNLHNGPDHLTTVNDNTRWLTDYLEQNKLGPVDPETFNDLDDGFLKSDYIVAFCDATLQKLYALFSSTPGMENTVYVVASDHGQAHGEHGEQTYYKHAYSTPWEYMVRVPAVIRFPKRLRDAYPSGRIDERVSLTDLFFTLAEIGDCVSDPYVRQVAELNGESLLARIRENRFDECVVTESFMVVAYEEIKAMSPELAVIYELRDDEMLAGNVYAMYQGRYKLIYAPSCRIVDRGKPVSVEITMLFDLQADPEETVNIASREPEVLDELMGCYRRHRETEERVDFDALGKLLYDPATLEQLKALGYVADDGGRRDQTAP
jgi:arylsulfatase A-like enzyme